MKLHTLSAICYEAMGCCVPCLRRGDINIAKVERIQYRCDERGSLITKKTKKCGQR